MKAGWLISPTHDTHTTDTVQYLECISSCISAHALCYVPDEGGTLGDDTTLFLVSENAKDLEHGLNEGAKKVAERVRNN